MIYLDNAATTPVRREVLEAMWPWLTGDFGNPSSHHEPGRRAANALADAHARVAAVLGCRAGELIFTSGGTEADNLALKGIALANPRGRHLVVSAIEHEAVRACCDFLVRHHGFTTSYIPVDRFGVVRPAALADVLKPDTTLCSVMLANNEVGTIEPIVELAALARAQGSPFHSDAVQAAGSLALNVKDLGVDALSLSGHKLGAPKGVGALFLRSGLRVEPVLHGGGQERGRRSGTENVAGAVGFATALELASRDRVTRATHMAELRDQLIVAVLQGVPHAILTGAPEDRLPGSASFCFPDTSGEAILQQLEEQGIVCSSGSACSAGSDAPSPVLRAMGYPPEVAQTAVRFTLSDSTTRADVEFTGAAVHRAHAAVQALAGPSPGARVQVKNARAL